MRLSTTRYVFLSLIGQLKKLLHNVTDELNSMGLSHEVVDELLRSKSGGAYDGHGAHGHGATAAGPSTAGSADSRLTPSSLLHTSSSEGSDAEPSIRPQGPSPASVWLSKLPHDHRYRQHRKHSRARSHSTGNSPPFLKTAENSPNTFVLQANEGLAPMPNSSPRRHSWGQSSAQTSADKEALPPLMLPSGKDSPMVQSNGPMRPLANMMLPPLMQKQQMQPVDEHDWNASHWLDDKLPKIFPEDAVSVSSSKSESSTDSGDEAEHEHNWIEGDSGRRAWAEYQILGHSLHLHPQLVVHIESPDAFSRRNSPNSNANPDTPKVGVRSGSNDSTPTASKANSPVTRLGKQTTKMSFSDFDLGPAAQELPTIDSPSVALEKAQHETPPGFHHRRIVIPLMADERFFESLAEALRKLLQLHMVQQKALVQHVDALSATIAQVASPVNSPKDLYQWREIFSLWLEHDIFESNRESDRGELSVATSEKRLRHYMRELEKRGFLAPHSSLVVDGKKLPTKLDTWEVDATTQTNPLSDPRSIRALEHFLRLNVALVSLKRFQRLNIETVRKILKKHEKKTALHAHQSLGRMIAQMEPNALVRAAASDSLLPELDWEKASHLDILNSLSALVPIGMTTANQLSLPRILASMLTKSLLPVLPSVDDYSCLVCMGLAYQPIRLRCSHLFCIRCLVKLQKQGNNNCPLCRSIDAVKDADEHNLDYEMAAYLRQWFPIEVEEKTQENKSDRLVEERKEQEMKKKKRFARFRRRHHAEDERNHDCVIV